MLRSLLTTTALVALLAGGAAYGQTTQSGGDATAPATPKAAVEGQADAGAKSDAKAGMDAAAPAGGFVTEQDGNEVLATDYIGQSVRNGQDEKVGDINDLVMDKDGKVTAAVIGVGGFLGVGEKQVGVPIDSIEARTDKDGNVQLVMQSTREELEAAPDFVDLKDKMDAQQAAREKQQMNQSPAPAVPAPATGGTTN
ncbi:Sporulation protein YlmC, PRC-barrel domain family [Tistlia consotensis]|uniref:Sporulation protein YlmC, PRC-barrel domain family n=1 Tax=Tistlia consotensis USBA 355 TaxID=560819 RepID=A0A1Y6C6I0_9PROT|nr:PRC-barrel domain-containing protein [Tistlia consotensis]SMF38762.1 Sporulation protein YlmC, PRC-barrel domain family [Tistlia consotensis USBA 355]SNR36867.1 Sporulation protein YlmC, PRC-barrel domain family [Tistlia consotensis]